MNLLTPFFALISESIFLLLTNVFTYIEDVLSWHLDDFFFVLIPLVKITNIDRFYPTFITLLVGLYGPYSTLLFYSFFIWFFMFILHVDHNLFRIFHLSVPLHFSRCYIQQSGNYAKSKRAFRQNGQKSELHRELKKLNEKKRSSKNGCKASFDTPKNIVTRHLRKYEPHVGNHREWLPTFGFMTSDGTGFHGFMFLVELICRFGIITAPNVFFNLLTLVGIYNNFTQTLGTFINVVGRSFRLDSVLLRSMPDQLTSFGASLINHHVLRQMTSCDSNNVEKWSGMILGLLTSTSLTNAGAIVFLHFKCYYNDSVSRNLLDYFMKVMGPADEYEPQSMEGIVSIFKQALRDWNNLRSSKLFRRVTDVIALIISTGMCKMVNMEFSLAGIPLFSDNLRKRVENANIIDVSQMVLEAITYFVEVGYTCFSKRSLRPILFDDLEAFEYDEKMLTYLRVCPLICDGDWEAARITYEEFNTLYDDLSGYLKTVYVSIQKGVEKKLIWDKIVMISRLKNDFDRRYTFGALRCAPWTMCVAGPSSIGKTTVGRYLNLVGVLAMGGEGSSDRIVTWNEGDEYFSNFKANVETIVLDDMCNTKPDFTQESPVAQLIKFNNNNPEQAVMADLESKGKLAIRPLSLLITTNVPDLLADVYSNEPVSILRRIDLRVMIKVKPEFAKSNTGGSLMLDPEKATAYCATLSGSEANCPDMWFLTAERCESKKNPVQGRSDVAEFAPVYCDHAKKFLTDCSLKEVAIYVARAAKKHREVQKIIVAKQTVLHKEVHICPLCLNLDLGCVCLPCEQAGDEIPVMAPTIDDALTEYVPLPFHEPVFVEEDANVHPLLSTYVYPMLREIFSFRFVYFLFMRSYHGFQWVAWAHLPWILHWTFGLGATYSTYWYGIALTYSAFAYYYNLALFVLNGCILRERWRRRIENFIERPMRRNMGDILRASVPILGQLILIKFLIDGVRAMSLFLRYVKPELTEQSALDPDADEYAQRVKTANPWVASKKIKLKDVKPKVLTTSYKDLSQIALGNLVHVQFGTKFVDGFYVDSNYMLVPAHFVTVEQMDVVITPKTSPSNSHRYRSRISKRVSYAFPGTDLCLVYAPGGCDKKNVIDYIPNENLSGSEVCTFAYRYKDGAIYSEDIRVAYDMVETQSVQYPGGHYSFKGINTFRGMCMGVLVSNVKKPHIVGFHLGGVTDTPHGCMGYVLRDALIKAMSVINSLPGVCKIGSSGEFPSIYYEKHRGQESFMSDQKIAPKCPTNYLPEDASVSILGSCEGGVTNKTQVIVSHISETVEKETGFERTHGPAPMGFPHVPSWHNWSLGMQGFSTPAVGPYPSEIVTASIDYLKGLDDIDFSDVAPLDMSTIVNGVDGHKFLNRMPQNTSVGFPISGKLSKYSVETEPKEDHAVHFELEDEIMDVYNQYKVLYAAGQRAYPVFRASLKDEPVKIGKLKVRVFQAAPVALKMILREFFLPIASHLSMYPLKSECAVGINAFSDEWGEMMNYIEANGTDRVVAGDYSAYDQRMPPSLTMAAFDIMLMLAKRARYSDVDICIMQSVIADVVYPAVAYNGTMVVLHGGNPSGHNLTVYINSIVNSLISRCAFYSHYPREHVFKDHVSMMTYGDDDIGSVRVGSDLYNNISKSDYINEIGMKYTPPSKEGDHIKFLELKDVDFLKRHDTFCPELGRRVGVLDLSSVCKSLHTRMTSSEVTDAEWAGSVIDGALRECAPRGREFYERMRTDLSTVATVHDFALHSINLSCSYDEMIDKIA
jgi:hypothetical protein